jgi:hypothetical protein
MALTVAGTRALLSYRESFRAVRIEAASCSYTGDCHLIQLCRYQKLPEGAHMSNLENALRELRGKRNRAEKEVEKLDQIISGIESLNGTGVSHDSVSSETVQPKRISAASRRKMALAQKARWANLRKKSEPVSIGKTSIPAPTKRTMSASARKKIAAAVRARWAKIRAAKKAA